jgi:prepilin-type N-terminal cleavage/methylation domain-containing protein
MSARRAGFTLLELLIVVAILAAIAAAAVAVTDQVDNQSRFDATKSRAQRIRDAIVGPGGQLNGSPVVQGFVADMGRLPASLDELVEPGALPSYATSVAVSTSPVWSSSFGSGWRGPYVAGEAENAAPMESGTARPVFRDGWGNVASSDLAASPDLNFGWSVSPSTGSFTFASLGSGVGTSWDAATTTWTIAASDAFVDVGSKVIAVSFTTGTPASTTLRIFVPFAVAGSNVPTWLESSVSSPVTGTTTINYSGFKNAIDGSTVVPIGTRSLVVWNTATSQPLSGFWTSLPQATPATPFAAYPIVFAPRVDPVIPTLSWSGP